MRCLLSLTPSAALAAALALSGCATTDSATVDSPPAPGEDQAYQCGDARVHAEFEADRVILHIGMGTLGLEPMDGASGARYGNRHGDEFHIKDAEDALFILGGDEPVSCQATDQLPPWREAELGGAGFWAVGQEPGWTAEVNNSETPALTLSLDYGQRELTFDRIAPFITGEGGTSFRGESDEHEVELHLERATCRDSMSGERFNATVELRVDESRYQGCGRFLRP